MSITYRKDLDRVLSAEEVDNNFLELETKSKEIELFKKSLFGDFSVNDKIENSYVTLRNNSEPLLNLYESIIVGNEIISSDPDSSDSFPTFQYDFISGENISFSSPSGKTVDYNFILGDSIELTSGDFSSTFNFIHGRSIKCDYLGCFGHGGQFDFTNHSQVVFGYQPIVSDDSAFVVADLDFSSSDFNLFEIKSNGVVIVSPLTKELITDDKHMTNKEYVDFEDATNLQTAKEYADIQDATNLQTVKDYADTQDATNLQTAKTYSEGSSGATADRPTTDIYVGSFYFDTDLGKPIWYNGSDWVDYSGTVV